MQVTPYWKKVDGVQSAEKSRVVVDMKSAITISSIEIGLSDISIGIAIPEEVLMDSASL